ncbi:MAG: cytochrome C [Bacillota bacterium]|nr:cytochrome C [Bacillota bacterium]MDP4169444.1 cytochrome C [Bacillota bacterium]
MKNAIISFVISALIGLGFGYVVFKVIGSHDEQPQASSTTNSSTQTKETSTSPTEDAKTVSVDENNILSKRGCLGCHSVGSLGLKGGQVGPDLSQAFVNVEGKHGIPIQEFLKKPTSAVMSGVLGKNPLTDDQRKQVLELLKKASETK